MTTTSPSSADWQVVEEGLREGVDPGHPSVYFAALARLREREARWERMNEYLDNVIHKERARVAELERELADERTAYEHSVERRDAYKARVARLEEALRVIGELPGYAGSAARLALAHEEEA